MSSFEEKIKQLKEHGIATKEKFWQGWNAALDRALSVHAEDQKERKQKLQEILKDVIMSFGQFLQDHTGYLSADSTESGAMPYITDYDLQEAIEDFFKSKKFEELKE